MIKIKCQLCGESADVSRICRECGASVPPAVYQKAKEADEAYKEFPAIFGQLESYRTVDYASVEAAEALCQKCSELLQKVAGFESFIRDDFNTLKAKTAALDAAGKGAVRRHFRRILLGERVKNIIATSLSLIASAVCLYLAYRNRASENLMDIYTPILITGAVLGSLTAFFCRSTSTTGAAEAGGFGLGIFGILFGIAGAMVFIIGMSGIGWKIFGAIIGAIGGVIVGGIAGLTGGVAFARRGTIIGALSGALSGAIILGAVVFLVVGAAEMMTDTEEELIAFSFRGGAGLLLVWCGAVWFASRPSVPLPLKIKAILTGIIGLTAAIFIIWKNNTAYDTPDGTWEFGRMIRITISGDNFTFSTKETGAFVDTNKGTLQIENGENGKEIAFAITGGLSESGEWAASSGEPQTLAGSLSDDGKSLILDELAYTKTWSVLDDIFAFIDDKENAENESAEPAAARVLVSANSANFREGPAAGTKALKTLKKGDILTVTGGADKGWLPVEHDGVQGYVSADLVSAAPAPVPALFGGRTLPGLYAGSAYQGYMDLSEIMNWIAGNAEDGGAYSIVPGKNQKVSDIRLDYGGRQVTVSLKGAGEEQIITYTSKDSEVPLFTVAAGATLTLEDGAVLSGRKNKKNKALVIVDGGTFIMNGGEIRNNTRPSDLDNNMGSAGGGVRVVSGTFTMNGGTIRDNAAKWGGGVYIDETGAFTMKGGTISANAASGSDSYGGGVYVNGGAFTMNNGSISGNTSNGNGGGVSVRAGGTFAMRGGNIGGNTAVHGAGVHGNLSSGGTFTKTGGIIYGSNAADEQKNRAGQRGHAVYIYISDNNQKIRDTTAGQNMALDSSKNGAAGGWGR
jgi:hypothetical protein